MQNKSVFIVLGGILLVSAAGYFFWNNSAALRGNGAVLDATPKNVTLTGTYECLPHKDTSGPHTTECAFGIKTPEGDHYAVNFGASAGAMEQFRSGATITADGFVVIREALSSDHWAKYDMKGIFTITNIHKLPDAVSAKINIDEMCRGALAYMTFPDAASAEAFVAECKEGKYPEVIEQYKQQMGLGDGAAI